MFYNAKQQMVASLSLYLAIGLMAIINEPLELGT
jgi:hypothetical protein